MSVAIERAGTVPPPLRRSGEGTDEGSDRRALRGRRAGGLAAVVVGLLLAWLVGYPLLVTPLEALGAPGGDVARRLRASSLRRPDEWQALWRSLWISLAIGRARRRRSACRSPSSSRAPSSPGAALLGGSARAAGGAAAARRRHRLPLPLRRERLRDARRRRRCSASSGPPWRLAGPAAILLVHAYSMYVYFYLFTRAALARLDRALARGGGGARRRRAGALSARSTLPLLRPALAGAALLTFMTALGSFSAPYLFGGSFRVMTTQILASKLNGDLDLAEVETVRARRGRARRPRLVARGSSARARSRRRPRRGAAGRGALRRGRPRAARCRRRLGARARSCSCRTPPCSCSRSCRRHLDDRDAAAACSSLANYRDLRRRRPSAAADRQLALDGGARRPRRRSSSASLAARARDAAAAAAAGRAARAAPRRCPGRSRAPSSRWRSPPPSASTRRAPAASCSSARRWLLPLAYLLRSLPLTGRAAFAGLRQLDPAARGGRGLARRRPRRARCCASCFRCVAPGARRRRRPRLPHRARRLRRLDRPLHLRQPPDLDRDPVQPAAAGDRRWRRSTACC